MIEHIIDGMAAEYKLDRGTAERILLLGLAMQTDDPLQVQAPGQTTSQTPTEQAGPVGSQPTRQPTPEELAAAQIQSGTGTREDYLSALKLYINAAEQGEEIEAKILKDLDIKSLDEMTLAQIQIVTPAVRKHAAEPAVFWKYYNFPWQVAEPTAVWPTAAAVMGLAGAKGMGVFKAGLPARALLPHALGGEYIHTLGSALAKSKFWKNPTAVKALHNKWATQGGNQNWMGRLIARRWPSQVTAGESLLTPEESGFSGKMQALKSLKATTKQAKELKAFFATQKQALKTQAITKIPTQTATKQAELRRATSLASKFKGVSPTKTSINQLAKIQAQQAKQIKQIGPLAKWIKTYTAGGAAGAGTLASIGYSAPAAGAVAAAIPVGGVVIRNKIGETMAPSWHEYLNKKYANEPARLFMEKFTQPVPMLIPGQNHQENEARMKGMGEWMRNMQKLSSMLNPFD